MALISIRNNSLLIAARDRLTLELPAANLADKFAGFALNSLDPGAPSLLVGLSERGLSAQIKNIALSGDINLKFLRAGPIREASFHGVPVDRIVHVAVPSDLRLGHDVSNRLVVEAMPKTYAQLAATLERAEAAGSVNPEVTSDSVECLIVDLELNRLDAPHNVLFLSECFRVLRKSGVLRLAAIVADDLLPSSDMFESTRYDVSRAFQELEVTRMLERAGFHGVTYTFPQSRPVMTFLGVELRVVFLEAFKGKSGPCLDQGHALIYRGPWSSVSDDDGHVFRRGERTAVCEKTFHLMSRRPYRSEFEPVLPYAMPHIDASPLFDCNTPSVRSPDVTKGLALVTDLPHERSDAATPTDFCAPGGNCC